MQAKLHSAGLAVNCHSERSEESASCFSGSLNLSISFTGKPGDLVLASGSVDQTGTYVFEVEPQGVGSSRSKYTNYWGVANGNDTMFNLFNPTNAAQDILATFYYGDGSGKYTLPVHLEPQASTMIDMAMLIAEIKPDSDGNVIPSNVREGSAKFASAKDGREWITLVIASGIYNVSHATCGVTWVNCCGVTVTPGSNPQVTPGSFSCAVGTTVTLSGSAVNCEGFSYTPDSWTSNNTSVATVDPFGNVSCAAAGSVSIFAQFKNMVATTAQICGPNPSCPLFSPQAGSSGTVQVPTSLQFISVSVLPDGTSGAVGCPSSSWSGIRVDIKYQVLDQQSPSPQPIRSSKMTPHEKGTFFSGGSYDNNIGPLTGYPTSSATTASDGTFHDVPFGACASGTFSSLTATQNITMIIGSNSYAVRSQNWTVTGTTSGHGTIQNSITSPGTGSDVSASR